MNNVRVNEIYLHDDIRKDICKSVVSALSPKFSPENQSITSIVKSIHNESALSVSRIISDCVIDFDRDSAIQIINDSVDVNHIFDLFDTLLKEEDSIKRDNYGHTKVNSFSAWAKRHSEFHDIIYYDAYYGRYSALLCDSNKKYLPIELSGITSENTVKYYKNFTLEILLEKILNKCVKSEREYLENNDSDYVAYREFVDSHSSPLFTPENVSWKFSNDFRECGFYYNGKKFTSDDYKKFSEMNDRVKSFIDSLNEEFRQYMSTKNC